VVRFGGIVVIFIVLDVEWYCNAEGDGIETLVYQL